MVLRVPHGTGKAALQAGRQFWSLHTAELLYAVNAYFTTG